MGTVEEAVRERDVVVVATNSPVPALGAGWIAPGTHVTTLGPRSLSRHEVPAAPPGRQREGGLCSASRRRPGAGQQFTMVETVAVDWGQPGW